MPASRFLLAVVATVLVIIVFPGQPEQKKALIVTQEIELPKNEIGHSISSSVFHKVRSFRLELHDNVNGTIFCRRFKFIRNGRPSGTWEKYAPER